MAKEKGDVNGDGSRTIRLYVVVFSIESHHSMPLILEV